MLKKTDYELRSKAVAIMDENIDILKKEKLLSLRVLKNHYLIFNS